MPSTRDCIVRPTPYGSRPSPSRCRAASSGRLLKLNQKRDSASCVRQSLNWPLSTLRCSNRATSLSAPRSSWPRPRSRTAQCHNGSASGPATQLGSEPPPRRIPQSPYARRDREESDSLNTCLRWMCRWCQGPNKQIQRQEEALAQDSPRDLDQYIFPNAICRLVPWNWSAASLYRPTHLTWRRPLTRSLWGDVKDEGLGGGVSWTWGGFFHHSWGVLICSGLSGKEASSRFRVAYDR